MAINTIVAMSKNQVIGVNGDLPWRLPEDLKRFKTLTMGHPIIMGRHTFESIGRPLPGRTNIILSRQTNYAPQGVIMAHDKDEAIAAASKAAGNEEIFIIGGGHIYKEFLDKTERFYLTLVDRQIQGDTFFPKLNWQKDFILINEASSDFEGLGFKFMTYQRNK